ncbi:MAG TPA: MG2 domain-containing protein [Burkholderiales bacterium]|nr:MG2 domain-containing protein [Burkholderiales bacterium]
MHFRRHKETVRRALICAAFALTGSGALAAPSVQFFNPQGQAKGVRQVTARFSEPVVAFGDPRLADPFNVQCEGDAAKGRGRWADTRNWVYDFESDLPAGQRCRFTLKGDFKAVNGQPIEGNKEFSFNTGGPAVKTSMPHEGEDEIDEEQVFILAMDSAIDTGSLSGAWCEADGVNERIPVKLVSEKETKELLEANRRRAYYLYNVYFESRRIEIPFARFKLEDKRWKDLPIVAVRCAQRLPAGAKAALVIGPTVKTRSGIERGQPQRLAYKVRDAFTVKLTCQRVNKDAACLPVTPIVLDFNASVPRDAAEKIRLKAKDGKTFEPTLDKDVSSVGSVEFKPPFPEKTSFTVELPRSFKDDADREPANKDAFPLTTQTDEFPPLAKFPGRFGILELNADPLLPLTVRNVEAKLAGRQVQMGAAIPGRTLRLDDEAAILKRHRDFMRRGHETRARKETDKDIREGEIPAIGRNEKAATFEVPRAQGEKEMEVIGIPLKRPGFYVVELASPRLGRALHGEDKPYYVSTSVLVTNLAVHLKHGRESSLVWVTSLDKGKPVPNAAVTVRDCTGKVWFEGKTDASGLALAGDKLPPEETVTHCGDYERVLVAFARVGEDLAFTYSSWNEGIQPWNFRLNHTRRARGPVNVHTVLDRMLFRAGETVSMKHIARVPVGAGFRIPQSDEEPTGLEIEHVGSGQKYKVSTSFDAQGIAESTWQIPQEAKLGTYEISWPGKRGVVSRASFRVEAFRVPLMRAVLNPPKEPAVRPKELKLDAAVTYLSGGAAANIPVKMRYRVEQRSVDFRDYSDFQFGGKPVKEGVEKGEIEDLWATYDPDEDSTGPATSSGGPTTVRSLSLDAAGTAKLPVDKLPPIDRPATLLVEMEYADPNGEVLAVSSRVPLHPSGVYVGIKPEGWAANKKSVRAQVVALDPAGKPLANRSVTVDVYERKSFSNRRRLVGGFYAYDTTTETRRVGSACSGSTDARGFMFCTVKPKASGELILVARAKDDKGNEGFATSSVWVQGDEEWWFEPSNNDRIDLIAEKKRYEPGETAKFQVRMPFRQATVLVTVEREGVLWQKVVELDAKSPTVEVPVLGNYCPNVYVSALALRGRVDPEQPGPYAWLKRWIYKIGYWLGLVDEVPVERDTRPTALVDLAKPAYKLGMTEIKVGRRDYTLNVKVTPERDVLKVRDTARVAIQVADADGKPAAGGEIALAAVDEGLLELMDNTSWNVLEALLGERPVEVMTATAQGMVIGKRHFGRKAVAPGGGGGRGGARELFDTLLLWKGRVPLDAQGRASMDIPLNDSLTSFRIVAVANAGAMKFGHGSTTVRTTQDLMLFSGLPPVVREQDEFNAMFTLRNSTAQPLATRFSWTVRDKPADDKTGKTLSSGESSIQLTANEARIVTVPTKTPVGVERLYWEVIAAGGSGQDRLRTNQKVIEVHPVRVFQATLARVDKPLELPVERPADAIAGRGGVRVDVMGSLGSELSAVREYFTKYPYTCLEQRTSKAIGLGDDPLWNALSSSIYNYLDRDGLARYFPIDRIDGSDALTAYLIQIADDSGREWPDGAIDRMLAGLEAFATGRITRYGALPTADLTIRKLAAIEALSRHDKARPKMLDSITIDPALWPTSALIDWIGILKRVKNVPQRDERLKEALGLLRGRMNFQGTVMTFSTERNDALWWLMASADVNANRALIAVLDDADWKEDVGRLVRGTLSRQKRGHWGTTVANAWGTVAMARFSEAFEKTAAGGTATITLGDRSLPAKVGKERQTQNIEWPSGRETLTIAHSGPGAPWAIVQSRAALPLKAPLFTGYSIARTVTPVEQKERGTWSRGDVYRVTLDVDAQSDMTWVVIDDPIPSGALILGSGLGRDAATLTQGEKQAGWATPTFIERTHEAYRAYYQFVPKGKFKIEYTVRLNNPGRFDLPSTRVEALYAPEMFGELPNQAVAVKP